VLVEAAFVLPVMVLLLLGIIEFGLLFTSYSTTNGSTRSAARIGATHYSQAGLSVPAQNNALIQMSLAAAADLKALNNAEPVGMVVYEVNPASSDGAPHGGFPGDAMAGGCTSSCVRFTWSAADGTFTRTGGSWTDPDACGVNVDSIGVFVQTRHDYLSGLLGSHRYVGAHTVMRLEPLPTDQCAGETPG
jgi:hypothetical protein